MNKLKKREMIFLAFWLIFLYLAIRGEAETWRVFCKLDDSHLLTPFLVGFLVTAGYTIIKLFFSEKHLKTTFEQDYTHVEYEDYTEIFLKKKSEPALIFLKKVTLGKKIQVIDLETRLKTELFSTELDNFINNCTRIEKYKIRFDN